MPPPSQFGVLVAEDDHAIRRLLATALRRRHLRVALAENGEEAIQALSQHRFAALVLDLMMPKVSGWDTIAWLAQNPDRRPVSVIVVSATERSSLQNLDATVVNAIVFKPFDVFQLAAYVAGAAELEERDRRRLRVVQP